MRVLLSPAAIDAVFIYDDIMVSEHAGLLLKTHLSSDAGVDGFRSMA